jgi:RNA polymerase sigma factor (sigma-70 family)
MSLDAAQVDSDRLQVQKCQQGDPNALAWLREKCHSALTNILLARGANRTEAEDTLADMWSDCVPGRPDRPALLEKYSGKCNIQGWLATVATNRWIDRKRRDSKQVDLPPLDPEKPEESSLDHLPAAASTMKEEALVELLRTSLQSAFASCPAELMVLLRLVYIHGLSQREVVRMLGWHESKVSRALSQAMRQIQTDTLQELKKRDPLLELTWQDFVDLCETQQIGFL